MPLNAVIYEIPFRIISIFATIVDGGFFFPPLSYCFLRPEPIAVWGGGGEEDSFFKFLSPSKPQVPSDGRKRCSTPSISSVDPQVSSVMDDKRGEFHN